MIKHQDILVVFDFDWSLINENSDTYVIEKFAPELENYLRRLYDDENGGFKGQWTKLMDHTVNKIMEEKDVTLDQLDDCLTKIPIFEEVKQAITLAHNKGATLSVLSDANEHYISVILHHHDLLNRFSRIVANYAEEKRASPGQGQTEGLRIRPYQSQTNPHQCTLCPTNLCKGLVLERWRRELSKVRRVVYVGDGKGDFCPACRLEPSDLVLCRRDWPLHRLMKRSPEAVQAEVFPWEDGKDILRKFGTVFD